MAQYVPLRVSLIEQGGFLADLDDQVREAQASIVAYRKEYPESAEAAKAVVTAKITIGAIKGQESLFSIVTSVSASIPRRPQRHTCAHEGVIEKTGELVLFVRTDGSSEDIPQQGVLFGRDGQPLAAGSENEEADAEV